VAIVQINDFATRGNASAKSDVIAALQITGQRFCGICDGYANMVKAKAALVDNLFINRRIIVLCLN
jgi:hypothetical protein